MELGKGCKHAAAECQECWRDLHLQHQKPKLGYNRKTNNTVLRRTRQNNTHIDLLLSPSLGIEINQAHRFSELKSRTKLLRRLPQLSFMPRTV